MPSRINQSEKSTRSKPVKVRQRLSAAERELQILDGAIKFFSERGLAGQTRDLAKEINITHPLLYHYFPTKKALIDRVYHEVYAERWKQEWEKLLDDKTVEFEEKLIRFYIDYAATILMRERVRIMIFSGLSDGDIPRQYLDLLQVKLFPRIVRETRRYLGLSLRHKGSERENELIWGLHGGIFYIGIRQSVYNLVPPTNLDVTIRDRVHSYVVSATELFANSNNT
ncbi:MAG: TetR/AcrR family transcriptional regulator [Herbaspirillum sp.]